MQKKYTQHLSLTTQRRQSNSEEKLNEFEFTYILIYMYLYLYLYWYLYILIDSQRLSWWEAQNLIYQSSPSSPLSRMKTKSRGSHILESGSNILEPPYLPGWWWPNLIISLPHAASRCCWSGVQWGESQNLKLLQISSYKLQLFCPYCLMDFHVHIIQNGEILAKPLQTPAHKITQWPQTHFLPLAFVLFITHSPPTSLQCL